MKYRWVWLCASIVPFVAGCRTYQITQFENIAGSDFQADRFKRAAIITHQEKDASGDRTTESRDRNQLFLEAFQVELMKRGMEVVEREKFEKLLNEQLLVQGDLAAVSDREKAMRLGKLLNVEIVFYADALISRSRYLYQKGFFLQSEAEMMSAQKKANESGVVEGIGKYAIFAYHDVGVTLRAIDATSGEIVWVGYRMLAVCEEVTEKSPTALTSFATIKKLCGMILDDFRAPSNRQTSKKG